MSIRSCATGGLTLAWFQAPHYNLTKNMRRKALQLQARTKERAETMSGHVLIQNRGEVPIWGIRLMGFSPKGDDKIGRFGTGLKESIALLARLGLQPIIFSGKLRMDFKVELMDGQEEICFKLSEERGRFAADEWHGLGIHPNLGRHDWDDPWMIFREVICNALDESGVGNLYHDICYHDPEGVAGATRFYVPATKEIVEAYETIEDKMLPLGRYEVETEVTGVGRAIKNRKKDKLQVFHRGVWIQENTLESLFDYEIDDIKLNESRSADWYTINSEVAKMVAFYTQPQAQELLWAVITDQRKNLYEADVLQSASYYVELDQQAWTHAFYALFGENAVLTDSSVCVYDKLKKVGRDPVVVSHSGLRDLLRAAGVRTAERVLTREQREWQSIAEPSDETRKVFDGVWNRLAWANMTFGAEQPELRLFVEEPGKSSITFGSYASGLVYLNESIVGSAKERQTCLEELAHHISKSGDETREFQTFLLEIADHFMGDQNEH